VNAPPRSDFDSILRGALETGTVDRLDRTTKGAAEFPLSAGHEKELTY